MTVVHVRLKVTEAGWVLAVIVLKTLLLFHLLFFLEKVIVEEHSFTAALINLPLLLYVLIVRVRVLEKVRLDVFGFAFTFALRKFGLLNNLLLEPVFDLLF